MPHVYLDLETYSTLNLLDVGTYKYACYCEVLLLSWCVDDGPICTWDATADSEMPAALRELFSDPKNLFVSHNTNFERNVLRYALDIEIPAERWHDTMILALTCGLPAKLDTLCVALGMGEDVAKIKDGRQLIIWFCKPAAKNHKADRYTRENKPEEWALFIAYCERDAELVRHLWQTLPDWTYKHERENWLLDQRINDCGMPIDTELAGAALVAIEKAMSAVKAELADLTDGVVCAVSETSKMATWINDRGVDCYSVNKESVAKLLKHDNLASDVRRVLEIRQQSGKSSGRKYQAALNAELNGRLYGSLQFYGAMRTGRWAGRQLQPQNMYRPTFKDLATTRTSIKRGVVDICYADVIEATSQCVRTVIAAPAGNKLVVSDLANIEGRMLAWLAGEQWKLDAFRAYDEGTGPDLYKLAYANSFKIPVETVTKAQRQIGKVEELALGFGGSIGAFNTMGAAYGLSLPEKDVKKIIDGWRAAHPQVKNYWRNSEVAAKLALQKSGTVFVCAKTKWLSTKHNGHHWLLCKLPSGRKLSYFEPFIGPVEHPWGPSEQVIYYSLNIARQWVRTPTWGGKLVENITQACARDVLAEGILNAETAGYYPVLTVHDEIVTEIPCGCSKLSETQLSRILSINPRWCEDLPLAAAGYESTFYTKE